jgi:hypothetical protein
MDNACAAKSCYFSVPEVKTTENGDIYTCTGDLKDMSEKYPNCWSVNILDKGKYECNQCEFGYFIDPATKGCLPAKIDGCMMEYVDNGVQRCSMCEGGKSVKTYQENPKKPNAAKMDSC